MEMRLAGGGDQEGSLAGQGNGQRLPFLQRKGWPSSFRRKQRQDWPRLRRSWVTLRPDLTKVTRDAWKTLAQAWILPEAPGEKPPLPPSSPSASTSQQSSLGQLITPALSPEGVGKNVPNGTQPGERGGRWGGSGKKGSPGAKAGAGQEPRQGGRKKHGTQRCRAELITQAEI